MDALKLMIPDDQVGIAVDDALKLMIPDDQVGIAVGALKLMIPDDQVGHRSCCPKAYDPR